MCAYCCGGTPVERRGEGHRNCSVDCYNATPRHELRRRLDAAEAELRAVRERVAEVLPTKEQFEHQRARICYIYPSAVERGLLLGAVDAEEKLAGKVRAALAGSKNEESS